MAHNTHREDIAMTHTLGKDITRTMGFCPEHEWQDASLPNSICPVCYKPMRDSEDRPKHYRITGGLQGGYIPSLDYCLSPDCSRDDAIAAWKDEAERWAEASPDNNHGWESPDSIYAEIAAIAKDEGPSLDRGGSLTVLLRESGIFAGETYDYVSLTVCDSTDESHTWDEDADMWRDDEDYDASQMVGA